MVAPKMNVFSAATRTCRFHTSSLRSSPISIEAIRSTTATRAQSRNISSTTTDAQAQPINLSSTTKTTGDPTPVSASDTSSPTPSILSRAEPDSIPPSPSSLSQPPPPPPPPPTTTTTTTTTSTTTPSTKSAFLHLGTITRTGTMKNTVQITRHLQTFDKFLQKHYTRPSRLLAHDPHGPGFLRAGDVVEFGPWSEVEAATKEAKRKLLEDRLLEKGVIRLRTRRGKERKLSEVGVRRRGPSWVVRRVVTPFGLAVADREAVVV